MPIGVCLSTDRVAAFDYGDHGSTFGGQPAVAVAALAVITAEEVDEALDRFASALATAVG